MDAIGTPTTERSSTRRWVAAALSVLLLMLAASAALAQEETEPIQPPEPVEAVGEVLCEPRTPVAGDTLTCTATGAEGLAELRVQMFLYSPASGPEGEGVILQYEDDVVLVEDGVATFAFVIDEWAGEGDRWEVYAWMFGGSRQDCFAIDRDTGQVVATGALEPADDDSSFIIGGETYSADGFSLVCTDEIRFDAFDIGLIGAAPEPGEEPVPPGEQPVPPADEQPEPPDEQPDPPATEPDVATESPVSETEATHDPEPDDAPPLPATGAALLVMLLTGALAVGGGLTMLRR
jgi:hypothetical protein